MDQENFLLQPTLFELKKEEEDILTAQQDNYFFDMNLMMLPDMLDKISRIFSIDVEIVSSSEYQQQRKRLLLLLLKYDIGLDILTKLIYRRDQSPLNGYYYLKSMDDFSFILCEMQQDLLDLTFYTNYSEAKIAQRITKLFNSILNRKLKEAKHVSSLQKAEVEKDIQLLKQQLAKVTDQCCYLVNFQFYCQHWELMFGHIKTPQFESLREVILCQIENNAIFNELESLQTALKLFSKLTIYQQELILTYTQLNSDLQIKEIRGKYFELYESFYLMDNLQEGDFQSNFCQIVKNLMKYYFDIENWKLIIIKKLIDLHQEQDAYELLLASKVDWSTFQNSDIIIQLLISSKRSLQAYIYATELKDEQVLRYFINEMIRQNEIRNLLKIDFTPDQDKIVNEIIKNLQEEQLLIEFAKKLLRSRKYYQAIQFYQMISLQSLTIGKQQIEKLIRKRISQLPEVEEKYYLAKIQGQELNDDLLLIESILDTQSSLETQQENQQTIKYFVTQPKLIRDRFINCCGWIRENKIGSIF